MIGIAVLKILMVQHIYIHMHKFDLILTTFILYGLWLDDLPAKKISPYSIKKKAEKKGFSVNMKKNQGSPARVRRSTMRKIILLQF